MGREGGECQEWRHEQRTPHQHLHRRRLGGDPVARPDSVLLDLNLGGTNGMQVLRSVHPLHPEIAFVVLTNHAEPQYRRACERAGAAYFLDKSTEFERVAAVIAEIAATHH